MEPVPVHGRTSGADPTYVEELLELLRILVVAGLSVGIVVAGLGGRLAMFLLRLTSPDDALGVTSDDGFVIGDVTLGGTYNLVTLGAAVGFIGAVAYVAVAPWLVGPRWFRRVTVALTAAALGGALLLHADGVDFVRLGPLWFAVALFLALPLAVGLALAVVVDAVATPGSWTARGQTRQVLPLALLVAVLLGLRRVLLPRLRSSTLATTGVRAAFLVIPVLSFVALGQDLAELY